MTVVHEPLLRHARRRGCIRELTASGRWRSWWAYGDVQKFGRIRNEQPACPDDETVAAR